MENSHILEEIRASEIRPQKNFNAWLLLGLSLLVFAGLGIFKWDLEYLIILAVAIFIHELGHLAAMKLFRYKNLKMLFLPLIGGIASGESKEQNSTKIALISLFGPLTGFLSCFAALVLWSFNKSPVLMHYTYFALLLNVFNLLPIVPLDGGYFLNETLFSRFPVAELVFRIFAVLSMGFLAYHLESWVFGILALLTFATLSTTYKMSRAADILRHEEGMRGGELTLEKVERIRQEIRTANPYFESEKNIKGLPNIIQSAWIKINKIFPSLLGTFGLLTGYLFVLIALPLVIILIVHFADGKKLIQYPLTTDLNVEHNPEKASFAFGEPLRFQLNFTNTSKGPLDLSVKSHDSVRLKPTFFLHILRNDGRDLGFGGDFKINPELSTLLPKNTLKVDFPEETRPEKGSSENNRRDPWALLPGTYQCYFQFWTENHSSPERLLSPIRELTILDDDSGDSQIVRAAQKAEGVPEFLELTVKKEDNGQISLTARNLGSQPLYLGHDWTWRTKAIRILPSFWRENSGGLRPAGILTVPPQGTQSLGQIALRDKKPGNYLLEVRYYDFEKQLKKTSNQIKVEIN
jgi:Zn-dependent protease